MFKRQFKLASEARDANATTRFFKLFPSIGWEEEGLEAYASFVVELVRVRAPASAKSKVHKRYTSLNSDIRLIQSSTASSPLYYITALTALLESVAMIVDQHQPIVEKYYGKGKMASVVGRLLEECDHVISRLVEGWEEERSMKRKLADTSATLPALSAAASRRQGVIPPEEEIDPRDIDKVLSEVSGIAGRWALFRKFLVERTTVRRQPSTSLLILTVFLCRTMILNIKRSKTAILRTQLRL